MKKVLKYGFVFLFSLFVLVFFSSINTYDSMWNYGFSYAFSKFQVPFLEFNMVIPGFYNMLMSIGLMLCHNNIIFLIEHAVIITITFYLLEKLFQKNAWLFLVFMCFPIFIAFTVSYNFFLLFLMILIVYLEENKKSDYVIGLLLGVSILTKQSVGFFFLIPSVVICFREKKRLLKRLIGVMIPCFLYVVYLLITGSLLEFLDLCVFGLFDFAKHNTAIVPLYFVLSILLFIISIIYVIFHKKDILGYYVLAFFSIMIPIFSYYHFYVYLVAVSCLLMRIVNIKGNYIRNLAILLCLIIVCFNIIMTREEKQFLNIHNFNYLYLPEYSKDNFLILDELYHKYKKLGNTEILSSKSVWVQIKNEEKLNYFSVYLTGNFGYDGSRKMIDRVKKIGESYYILDNNEYQNALKNNEQFEIETTKYIIKNSKIVDEVGDYIVYHYGVVE